MPHTRSQGASNLAGPLDSSTQRSRKAAREPCEPTAKEIAAADAARARLYGAQDTSQAAAAEAKLPSGPEPVSVEVEYISSEDLQPLDDPQSAAQACEAGLASKVWTDAIAALNTLRQLTVHHADDIRPLLARLVPLLLSSVKSLRSVQAKTAIMACCDMFASLPEEMLSLMMAAGTELLTSSLLAQLLLKAASNDKRFVIEETERACHTMAAKLDAAELTCLLLPFIKHKNAKVRGKAGMVLVESTQRLLPTQLADAAPALMGASGALISDNTPDARTAAKQLVLLLRSSYGQSAPLQAVRLGKENSGDHNAALLSAEGSPAKSRTPWESFVYASTTASAATAVLRVYNT